MRRPCVRKEISKEVSGRFKKIEPSSPLLLVGLSTRERKTGSEDNVGSFQAEMARAKKVDGGRKKMVGCVSIAGSLPQKIWGLSRTALLQRKPYSPSTSSTTALRGVFARFPPYLKAATSFYRKAPSPDMLPPSRYVHVSPEFRALLS